MSAIIVKDLVSGRVFLERIGHDVDYWTVDVDKALRFRDKAHAAERLLDLVIGDPVFIQDIGPPWTHRI